MAKTNRTAIPQKTADKVLFISDHRCCICKTFGGQIHHIKGNTNHDLDNLAFLCLDCHHEATRDKGLKRKYSAGEIKLYRDQHYNEIASARAVRLKGIGKEPTEITEETLYNASITALIILKIDEIKEEFFSADVQDREVVLNKLSKYSEHTNTRISLAIMEFLHSVAIWNNLTTKVASNIVFLTMDFIPTFWFEDVTEGMIIIAKMALNTGEDLVYEGAVDINNFDAVMYGLTILKYIHRFSNANKVNVLVSEVQATYTRINETLQGYNRLDQAIELLSFFKADLATNDLAFPSLPEHMMKILYAQRAERNKKKPITVLG